MRGAHDLSRVWRSFSGLEEKLVRIRSCIESTLTDATDIETALEVKPGIGPDPSLTRLPHPCSSVHCSRDTRKRTASEMAGPTGSFRASSGMLLAWRVAFRANIRNILRLYPASGWPRMTGSVW